MYAIWQIIIGFIGGPVIKGLIDAYNLHLQAQTKDEKIAADLAGQEIAAQTAEIQAQAQIRIAEIGHPFEPDKIMGYTVAFLFAKIVIWDICLGLGTTDLHPGFVTTTSGIIISFYFGKRTFENVARIIHK